MKKSFILLLLLACVGKLCAQPGYTPTNENLESRAQFEECRLGIFLHWGIYSILQQDWSAEYEMPFETYMEGADYLYPYRFNAREWVKAFKDAGAGYITFTSRHHEGFSMWATKQNKYNIVDATPYGKDIVAQLADACHEEGIRLHLYYSLLDWSRDDYPTGRTGREVGCVPSRNDYPHYLEFMKAQLTELLTNYGKIGAIWFDGMWDHDQDAKPFDWHEGELYSHIHSLQPACLVGNNHHRSLIPGEDFQMFERDLPGENTTGWVHKDAKVSTTTPLETCTTMSDGWGYKITDDQYKSLSQLVSLLVRTSGLGANLLINISPRPNGLLPQLALSRLKEMGQWMRQYGTTIKGTKAGDIKPQYWGATTRRGNHLFVHVTRGNVPSVTLPLKCKVQSATNFATGEKVTCEKTASGYVLTLPEHTTLPDLVIDLVTK